MYYSLIVFTMLTCFMISEVSAQILRYQGPDGRIYFLNKPLAPAAPQSSVPPHDDKTPGGTRKAPQPGTQEWNRPATRDEWEAFCVSMGTLAANTVASRDAGMSLARVLQTFDTFVKTFPRPKRLTKRDRKDVAYALHRMRRMMVQVYGKRTWSPATARHETALACLAV